MEVQSTGLTLLADAHHIGATADGLMGQTVLKIKCPFRAQSKTVLELVNTGYNQLSLVGNDFILKESSSYYCQVQGEMAIKNCKLCHFIVWTPYDMKVIPVTFNETFWSQSLLPKLLSFFDSYIKPHLLKDSP